MMTRPQLSFVAFVSILLFFVHIVTMKGLHLKLLLLLSAAISTEASGIVYITDLPSFSSLAPCAGEAVSYVVGALSHSECQPAVTALESCACTKNQNSVAASSSISSLVLEYCATTASEDVSSASVVFDNYCNQGTAAATQTVNANAVTQYITDLPAFSLLGPCAGSALSYAVQVLTNNDCPSPQAELATCACTKNQNSLSVSEYVNSLVLEYCGSTHSEDVTSAQGVFSGYCGLGNGTSSFPSNSALAGDVTYYITDLPEFSSLAPCAGSAVSYEVLSQTNNDCPAAPGALVSCACVKDQNSLGLSSGIANLVGEYCDSTASDDISSALSVFAFYCSAGHGQVTPTGVVASVTTTALGGAGTGAKTTTSKNSLPTKTASSSGTGSGSPSGSTPAVSIGPKSGGSHVPIGAIIGGAVGALVLTALILFAGWRYRRRHQPHAPVPGEAGNNYTSPPPHEHYASDKAELASTSAKPVSSPILRKALPAVAESENAVSPIKHTRVNELASPPAPSRAEAPGTTNVAEMQGVRDPAEVLSVERPHMSEMADVNAEAVEMSATSGPFELHGHQE